MTSLRFRQPALLATLIGAACGLSACDDRWSTLDPPKVVQLSCTPLQGGQDMVLVIDTGLKRATWANGAGVPEGEANVTEHEYRLHFPATASVREFMAVINRYDRSMEREVGSPPFLQARDVVTPGNIRLPWRCALEKEGPKL